MGFLMCLGLAIACIAYLLVGGAIFHAIERPREQEIQAVIDNTYRDFIENNSCVSERELLKLSSALLAASDAGVRSSNISTATGNNWDFDNAIFFCFTAISTIGYGNIAPTTAGGQVMFIFYSMFGIPLMLTVLAHFGLWISYANRKVANKLRFYNNRKLDKLFDGLLLYLIGCVVCVVLPGFVLCAVEGWTYVESVYFAVTTISTVGFGDYVPERMHTEGFLHSTVYPIGVSGWCVLGLTWFAGLIRTIQGCLEGHLDKPKQEPFTPTKKHKDSQLDSTMILSVQNHLEGQDMVASYDCDNHVPTENHLERQDSVALSGCDIHVPTENYTEGHDNTVMSGCDNHIPTENYPEGHDNAVMSGYDNHVPTENHLEGYDNVALSGCDDHVPNQNDPEGQDSVTVIHM